MKKIIILLLAICAYAEVPHIIPQDISPERLPALLNRNFDYLEDKNTNTDKQIVGISTGIAEEKSNSKNKKLYLRDIRAEQRYTGAGQIDDSGQTQMDTIYGTALFRVAGVDDVYRTVDGTFIYFSSGSVYMITLDGTTGQSEWLGSMVHYSTSTDWTNEEAITVSIDGKDGVQTFWDESNNKTELIPATTSFKILHSPTTGYISINAGTSEVTNNIEYSLKMDDLYYQRMGFYPAHKDWRSGTANVRGASLRLFSSGNDSGQVDGGMGSIVFTSSSPENGIRTSGLILSRISETTDGRAMEFFLSDGDEDANDRFRFDSPITISPNIGDTFPFLWFDSVIEGEEYLTLGDGHDLAAVLIEEDMGDGNDRQFALGWHCGGSPTPKANIDMRTSFGAGDTYPCYINISPSASWTTEARTSYFNINSTGNVGLGINSAIYTLDIAGYVNVNSTDTADYDEVFDSYDLRVEGSFWLPDVVAIFPNFTSDTSGDWECGLATKNNGEAVPPVTGYEPWRALDGLTTTYYINDGTVTNPSFGWVAHKTAGEQENLSRYTIQATSAAVMANNWIVYSKQNGIYPDWEDTGAASWNILDIVGGEPAWGSLEKRTFDIDKAVYDNPDSSATDYIIVFGAGETAQIAEITFHDMRTGDEGKRAVKLRTEVLEMATDSNPEYWMSVVNNDDEIIAIFDGKNKRFGVGSTTPTYKLDVEGIVNAEYFYGDGSYLTNLDTDTVTYAIDAGTAVYADNSGLLNGHDTDYFATASSMTGVHNNYATDAELSASTASLVTVSELSASTASLVTVTELAASTASLTTITEVATATSTLISISSATALLNYKLDESSATATYQNVNQMEDYLTTSSATASYINVNQSGDFADYDATYASTDTLNTNKLDKSSATASYINVNQSEDFAVYNATATYDTNLKKSTYTQTGGVTFSTTTTMNGNIVIASGMTVDGIDLSTITFGGGSGGDVYLASTQTFTGINTFSSIDYDGFVSTAGDTMSGKLNMGGNHIIYTSGISNASDVGVLGNILFTGGAININAVSDIFFQNGAGLDMNNKYITHIDWANSDDGAGSLLDADLLDAQEGAYYAIKSAVASSTDTLQDNIDTNTTAISTTGIQVNTNISGISTNETAISTTGVVVNLNTDHRNDNSQAHSDYLLNTSDTMSGSLDIGTTLDVTGETTLDSVVNADGGAIFANGTNLAWGSYYAAYSPLLVGVVDGVDTYLAIYPSGSTAGEKFRIGYDGALTVGNTIYADGFVVQTKPLPKTSTKADILKMKNKADGTIDYDSFGSAKVVHKRIKHEAVFDTKGKIIIPAVLEDKPGIELQSVQNKLIVALQEAFLEQEQATEEIAELKARIVELEK